MSPLCLFLYAFVAVVASQTNPVVRVNQGVLSGKWAVSLNGRSYASFTGVPYARPPVGKYRFREPQHMKPWTGVWDATHHLPHCLQYDPFEGKVAGSENCLYLNVYTPKPTAGANLPVLFYIHGGAFMYGGSSIYSPTAIMDWDMVVVTLNYRLGPLGFLSTGDEVVPGNFGLKDQAFALNWVKNNIMMFGGNPDSVTLTGCSAGGASVHYQYLSPLSRGTFARGIAFSGSALSPWTHAVKPAQKAKTLATLVGCPTTNSREMADCLKYRPAEALVQAQIEMFDWKVHMFTPFTPTAEAANVREPFLTQYPYLATKAGQMQKVPLITTVTSEEGLYPGAAYQLTPDILPDLEANWETLASNIFEYNDTLPVALRKEVAAKIKQRYLGGRPVGQDTFAQLIQALGDRLFVAEVGKLSQLHALRSGQPVYTYRYSYRGEKSLSNLMAGNNENYGTSHADDLFHIFQYPGTVSTSKEDQKMSSLLIDMVYTYATQGVPKFPNAQWNPVKPGAPELDYLSIESPTKIMMQSSTDFGLKSFWDSLGFIENENYRPNFKGLHNLKLFNFRVPKFPNAQWNPVKPGAPELDYLSIESPTKIMMQSSTDFGLKSFWDSLGFIENENYRPNLKDEL